MQLADGPISAVPSAFAWVGEDLGVLVPANGWVDRPAFGAVPVSCSMLQSHQLFAPANNRPWWHFAWVVGVPAGPAMVGHVRLDPYRHVRLARGGRANCAWIANRRTGRWPCFFEKTVRFPACRSDMLLGSVIAHDWGSGPAPWPIQRHYDQIGRRHDGSCWTAAQCQATHAT